MTGIIPGTEKGVYGKEWLKGVQVQEFGVRWVGVIYHKLRNYSVRYLHLKDHVT